MEIYKEVITDLLLPMKERSSLSLREHPKSEFMVFVCERKKTQSTDMWIVRLHRFGFFVDGLFLKPCTDLTTSLVNVTKALRDRHTGSHDLNAHSSRSHCALTIHVDSLPKNETSANADDSFPPTYGAMTFVDLAGSERPKETGSSGITLKETCHINRSLYVLGKVIAGLAKNGRRAGTPFRDSALTKILVGSLGGSSKTTMIACISPAKHCISETRRTLAFANQVKGIQNQPVIQLDPREKLIHELKLEIEHLRSENGHLITKLREQMATAPTTTVSSRTSISEGNLGLSNSPFRPSDGSFDLPAIRFADSITATADTVAIPEPILGSSFKQQHEQVGGFVPGNIMGEDEESRLAKELEQQLNLQLGLFGGARQLKPGESKIKKTVPEFSHFEARHFPAIVAAHIPAPKSTGESKASWSALKNSELEALSISRKIDRRGASFAFKKEAYGEVSGFHHGKSSSSSKMPSLFLSRENEKDAVASLLQGIRFRNRDSFMF